MAKRIVKIDASTLATVCPYHGAVGEVDYAPAKVAPCGCQWYLSADDGLLHALQVDEDAHERAASLGLLAT